MQSRTARPIRLFFKYFCWGTRNIAVYVKLENYNVDSKNNNYLFFHFTAAGIGLLTFDRTNYVRDRVLSLLDVDNKIIVKCNVIWKIFSKNLKFKYNLFRCIKRFNKTYSLKILLPKIDKCYAVNVLNFYDPSFV